MPSLATNLLREGLNNLVCQLASQAQLSNQSCANASAKFHHEVQVNYCEALVLNLQNRFPDLPIISWILILICMVVSDPDYG